MSINIIIILFIILCFVLDIIKNGFIVTLFKPFSIFNVFFLVFFIVPMEIGLVFFSDFIKSISFTDYFSEISLLIAFLLFVLRIIDLRYFEFNAQPKLISKFFNFSIKLSLFIYFILLTFISLDLFIVFFQGSDLTSASMKLRNGGALKFFLLASCEFIPLIYLVYTNGKKGVFFYFIFILSIFFIMLLGARSLILSMLFSILLFLLSKKLLKLKNLIYIGVVLITVFIFTSLNRSGGKDLAQYLSNNLDQLTNTAVVFEKIESNQIDFQYGGTFIDAIYFFIPSSIWPNKPKSYLPSRLVYPDMIDAGVESDTKYTMNFGLIGRTYLDFGYLGVILISSFLLYFLNKLYFKIRNNLFKNKINTVMGIYIYSHIHQFLIIGPVSHIYSIYLFNFILILLIVFIARLVHSRNHTL
jgi:oligosaccharide repeat unit polymerase